MKRLLIVEDDQGFRSGLHDVIATCQDVFHQQVDIHEAATWEAALMEIEGFQPDVILLDLTFASSADSPGQSRDETIAKLYLLSKEWPPVVILTGSSEDEIRRRCFDAGASDFIFKSKATMKHPETIAERLYNAFLRRSCRLNYVPQ